jgi:hypothetical protein
MSGYMIITESILKAEIKLDLCSYNEYNELIERK